MNQGSTPNLLQRYALPPLQMGTILLGFSIPLSVALDNILLAMVLLGVLFHARVIAQTAMHNPVARAAWLLFGMLALAMTYGATPWREALGILGKYVDLAFIPMFMLLLADVQSRSRAQSAFIAAMGLTLLASLLVGMKLLALQPWMNQLATADNPAVFHSHIAQNNMMALAIFLALLRLRDASSLATRTAWSLFALLAMINVLFMVQGRTGYLILLALIGWFGWTTLTRYRRAHSKTWGWPQGVAVLLLLSSFAVAAYQISPRVHDRVNQVSSEFHAWQPNHGNSTSTGQRLDFYYNTLQIVQEHPLLGVGTGGFPAAYAQQVQGTGALSTHNPHNEYLMIATQTGLPGLALLLYLFYTQWRYAGRLDTPFAQDAARGLMLAYLVNCMFNSALLDHSDGLLFAFMTAVLFANLRVTKRD